MENNKTSVCVIIFIAIVLLFSCNKNKNNLYSVSVSPYSMIGTPAEMFSLGQIRIFQANNNLICSLMENLSLDSSVTNYTIAPMHLIYNILADSISTDWQKGFAKHYNLTELSNKQFQQSETAFLNIVKDIDSSINIESSIYDKNDSSINIVQHFEIKLIYQDVAPNNVDNIFTTINNKKPRLDFITINGNIRSLTTSEEQVVELPIGNGNYMLMLIRPKLKSIREYMLDFSEEKYFSFIKDLQERRNTVSFPLISIKGTLSNIPMPQYSRMDSVIHFSPKLNLIHSFVLKKVAKTDINIQKVSTFTDGAFSFNNSDIIKYSSPFLFIIRGKNSNLIIFVGIYCDYK